jgi:hypothetical protein
MFPDSTNDQKQRRVNMCLELQEKANKDPTFISRIITVEEPTITKSKNGVAGLEFIVLFNVKGIVHCEFVPPNTMVNSDF